MANIMKILCNKKAAFFNRVFYIYPCLENTTQARKLKICTYNLERGLQKCFVGIFEISKKF